MDRFFLLSLLLLCLPWRIADSAKISCKTCKKFVVSFQKRFDDTANSNYAGGDTSWEEEKLGSYSNSEVRLVEILDTVCGHSDYDCHRLLEDSEEAVERWWFKQKTQDDLGAWLCFKHLDVCCPENTFGPTCEQCPGAPDNMCSGHGKCEGVEEKDGSGTCSCDKGYGGDLCQSCDKMFYQEVEGDDEESPSSEVKCKECDKSCSKSCDGPGAGDCAECADGYKETDDGICEDMDECKIDGDTRCKEGMYCYNTPGSFRCNDCDKSCEKVCSGPGPARCAECAVGYTRSEHGTCKDDDECSEGSAECSHGTYCENTPGKYTCKACHIACLSGCHGAGTKGCVACKEGYVMSQEEGCEDKNECESEPGPCESDTEECVNMVGTHVCKCKGELVRGEEGRCVSEDERDRQRQLKKTKKKKKKKKKQKAVPTEPTEGEKEGEERVALPTEGEKEGEERVAVPSEGEKEEEERVTEGEKEGEERVAVPSEGEKEGEERVTEGEKEGEEGEGAAPPTEGEERRGGEEERDGGVPQNDTGDRETGKSGVKQEGSRTGDQGGVSVDQEEGVTGSSSHEEL